MAMTSLREISLGLISENEVRQKLTSVFVESIILTNKFEIDLVSKDVLEALGYALGELKGRNISSLNHEINLQNLLLNNLNRGFFEEIVVALNNAQHRHVMFSISGFYLGVVSDINGYIILKVKNLDKVREHNTKLEHDREELDNFIYRAAHDIRGPLATMRGLINLMKLRKDDSEINMMLGMLDASASRLDERLFKLLYLAESNEAEVPSGDLKFSSLETSLRETLVQNCPLEEIDLHFKAQQAGARGMHEHLVQSLLNNILLYIVSLPKCNAASIVFHCSSTSEGISVDIQSEGFQIEYKLRQALRQKTSLYSELLIFPSLINYYAARKIALSLNAELRISFLGEDIQEMNVLIPFHAAGA
ncbi:ATP-binding protein [Ohtaekwangia koreensis]|uniref:histidine kinase n=1 Tax=Ohtaekwangia koreensis TaxID=688867 RepID=A0A1T5K443_9BACT|nr:HAMP domain-containing histidine kinase [Ohtaekwangia koreensis]SKC58423.1 hypothetical protein SAMN05660236_1798 [Ohtaekwangia koreensis]